MAIDLVYERDGRLLHVSLEDAPQPELYQFWAALRGSSCPKVDGVDRVTEIWNQQSWKRDLDHVSRL